MDKCNEMKQQILATLSKMDISVKRIILFGSRARGEFEKYSDYDIFIVTEKTFSFQEKMAISEKIRDGLVKLRIASDIIMKSEEEVEYYQSKIGSVVREALKEGVIL